MATERNDAPPSPPFPASSPPACAAPQDGNEITLRGVSFDSNRASNFGGALRAQGILLCEQCSFTNNKVGGRCSHEMGAGEKLCLRNSLARAGLACWLELALLAGWLAGWL